MERRREPRIQADEPVRVTVLSDGESVIHTARLVDLSGRGLRISLAEMLRIGAPVKIERSGEMLLGEVVYVHASGAGFQAGIEIDQAFRDTQDLDRLRRAIEELQPAPVVNSVPTAD